MPKATTVPAGTGRVSIVSAGLVLRPWADDDAPAVLAAARDPEIRLWQGATMVDLAEALAWVRSRADWSTGDHASFAMSETPDSEALGSISLHKIDREQGDAEVGYWVALAARGRGLARRAVVEVCRWAFAEYPIDRIELYQAVENVASGRVAAAAGFTLEGRLRRSFRYGDGVKHDEQVWSRLADDPPVALPH